MFERDAKKVTAALFRFTVKLMNNARFLSTVYQDCNTNVKEKATLTQKLIKVTRRGGRSLAPLM